MLEGVGLQYKSLIQKNMIEYNAIRTILLISNIATFELLISQSTSIYQCMFFRQCIPEDPPQSHPKACMLHCVVQYVHAWCEMLHQPFH